MENLLKITLLSLKNSKRTSSDIEWENLLYEVLDEET